MRVGGWRSNSMFRRYDITSMDDKADALRRPSEYVKIRAAVGENVSTFFAPTANGAAIRDEIPASFVGNLVAVEGFEPPTQRI